MKFTIFVKLGLFRDSVFQVVFGFLLFGAGHDYLPYLPPDRDEQK